MEELIAKAISYINDLFAYDHGGHDAAHTLRVYKNALRIARTEPGCDMLTVSLGALFIHDSVSGAFMLACEDTEAGKALLDRNGAESFDLLMVSDHALGKAAFERYGFSGKLECYQVAYYGEKPETNTELTVRTARMDDLTILTENYDLLSPEELRMLIERQSILMGYHDGELVGFIGEHLEGSMDAICLRCRWARFCTMRMTASCLIPRRTQTHGASFHGTELRRNRRKRSAK